MRKLLIQRSPDGSEKAVDRLEVGVIGRGEVANRKHLRLSALAAGWRQHAFWILAALNCRFRIGHVTADDRLGVRGHRLEQLGFVGLDREHRVELVQFLGFFFAADFNPMYQPTFFETLVAKMQGIVGVDDAVNRVCLLYTSDAADE